VKHGGKKVPKCDSDNDAKSNQTVR
jgi:hypothetical protein